MWRFLRALIKLRLKLDLAFRIDAIFNWLTQVVYLVGSVLLFNIIYHNVSTVGGWNLGDMYILLGTYNILTELYNMTFRGGVMGLPDIVKNGNLEIYFLRPVNAVIFLLLRRVNLGSIWRILPGVFLVSWGLQINGYPVGLNLLVYIVALLLSLLIYTFSASCISLLSFWFYEVNNFFYIYDDLTSFAKYPDSVYSGVIRKVFLSVIPVIVLCSFPTRMLIRSLGFGEGFGVEFLLLSAFFLAAAMLWSTGLHRYQGKG